MKTKKPNPRAGWEPDQRIIDPPGFFTVFDSAPKPILYDSTGTPLVRKPAGFDTGKS